MILHALGRTGHPAQLIDRYGNAMVRTLWDAVSRDTVAWIQELDFGVVELDCLLIHGSPMGVDDELNPETSPLDVLDRLMRTDVNLLFCGRSGLAFEAAIQSGSLESTVQTLDRMFESEVISLKQKKVVGVGNVGRSPGKATYTLYSPGSNEVRFQVVNYGVKNGFGKR